MTKNETRILRALRHGPTYLPLVELAVGKALGLDKARRSLVDAGLIERVPEIGPLTYQLTGKGRLATLVRRGGLDL